MNDIIKSTFERVKLDLLRKAGVVAVGIGYKTVGGVRTSTPAIVCSVIKKLPIKDLSTANLIPAQIESTSTDVIETGIIRALQDRTKRWRPAPGGVSIGHEKITAGTLGCLVEKGGKKFILSNNHVLANMNEGAIGDAILQPGTYDGGAFPYDRIATLAEFVKINFIGGDGCPVSKAITKLLNFITKSIKSKSRFATSRAELPENRVDAAIAEPLDASWVLNEILEVGKLLGIGEATLGLGVKKSGRTSGLTHGTIDVMNVAVQVQYGDTKIAYFVDQLQAGAMSEGGDSGSAVVDDENRLVGLLFAGSDTTTIINPIGEVFSALQLDPWK
ncbi:MAG: S1 family peptidase [Candidatus Aminicenantes bacterium]|nr:S1 family peptidase [Candidatus Aminicenantes bacterium]